jgi:flagellum-specific peptidoglycan hydrolase FlgJ
MKLKTTVLALFLFFTFLPQIKSEGVNKELEEPKESFRISYMKLYEQIIKTGVKFPEIVFAQAVLESAHFKSPLFERANNLFGMQYPIKRETTAVSSTNGYSKYENWHESVYDYKLWQDFLFNRRGELTQAEYFAYLHKWYAEDKKYVTKVKNKIKEFSFIFENFDFET